MKKWNIKSFCNSACVLNSGDENIQVCNDEIKVGEIDSLQSLISELSKVITDVEYQVFIDYYISYKIPQIGKEFDLLKVGEDTILNIELKGKGINSNPKKMEKILKQMKRNFYYLNFAEKDIRILTFVEDDGFYKYDKNTDTCIKISVEDAKAVILTSETSDVNLSELFIPSRYLISPFNKTQQFVDGQYFLTQEQEDIKNRIIDDLNNKVVSIHGKAGTGKSLLLYDIAKLYHGRSYIVHVGYLNEGHKRLIEKGFKVLAIYQFMNLINKLDDSIELIVFDESHRLLMEQVKKILELSPERNILFAYDNRQHLRNDENKDVHDIIKNMGVDCSKYILNSKIRTNSNISYFIQSLFNRDNTLRYASKDLDHSFVSLEYFNTVDDAGSYLSMLSDWKVIYFSNSLYEKERIDEISSSDSNSHKVIGQEFEKVVILLNDAFSYSNNSLEAKRSYYHSIGMLYQNVTRAVSELKVIVINNPDLFTDISKMYVKLYNL